MKSIMSGLLAAMLCLLGISACMGPINRNVLRGHDSLKNDNYEQALACYQAAASYRNPQAEYALGYMYYYGTGVPKDLQQAIIWWTRSSSWNYKPANDALAQLDRELPVFQY